MSSPDPSPSTSPVPNEDDYVSFTQESANGSTPPRLGARDLDSLERKATRSSASHTPVQAFQKGLNGSRTPAKGAPDSSAWTVPEPKAAPKRATVSETRRTISSPSQSHDVKLTPTKSSRKLPPPVDTQTLSFDGIISVDSGSMDSPSPAERVLANKKKLQAQRRRGKSNAASNKGINQDSRQVNERTGRQTGSGSDWMEELLPFTDKQKAPEETRTHQKSEYTALHVSDSTSIWNQDTLFSAAKANGDDQDVTKMPASEGLQSPSSCYSESAFSGISRNSSGVTGSSPLANKAERLLQKRRKSRKPAPEQHPTAAKKSEQKVLYGGQQNQGVAERTNSTVMPHLQMKDTVEPVHARTKTRQVLHMVGENESPASKMRREAGFATKYQTSSRFIETDIGGPNARNVNTHPDAVSVEDTMSMGSATSSFRTPETGSTGSVTGSESYVPSFGRDRDTRSRKARISDRDGKSVATLETVPDEFIDESSSNMDVFKRAFESVGLAQIASDWAGEVTMAGLDITRLAKNMNSRVQSFKGGKKWAAPGSCTHRGDVPFDEEDVAIEVEYLEDSVVDVSFEEDTHNIRDLGGCALVDDAVEDDTTWDDDTKLRSRVDSQQAPTGQPSFEHPPSNKTRSVTKAAYV